MDNYIPQSYAPYSQQMPPNSRFAGMQAAPTPPLNMPYAPPPMQPQPNQQPIAPMPGRIVNSLEEILPNEVPMDGSRGVFPKADKSCIYVKYWDGTNGIKTDIYVLQDPQIPAAETSQENSTNELESIKNQLNRIEKKLAKQTKTFYSQNSKKESTNGR